MGGVTIEVCGEKGRCHFGSLGDFRELLCVTVVEISMSLINNWQLCRKLEFRLCTCIELIFA